MRFSGALHFFLLYRPAALSKPRARESRVAPCAITCGDVTRASARSAELDRARNLTISPRTFAILFWSVHTLGFVASHPRPAFSLRSALSQDASFHVVQESCAHRQSSRTTLLCCLTSNPSMHTGSTMPSPGRSLEGT